MGLTRASLLSLLLDTTWRWGSAWASTHAADSNAGVAEGLNSGATDHTSFAETSAPNGVETELKALRALLRRYPYWIGGHVRLGELSLSQNAVNVAHASASVVLVAQGATWQQLSWAHYTLGRCMLRTGDAGRSLVYLRRAETISVEHDDPALHTIREEIAAASLLANDYSGAYEILNAIPERARSSEGSAALRYVLTKLPNLSQ